MKRGSVLSSVLATFLICCSAVEATTARVTTGANDGPGSLREALASGATVIRIDASVRTIVVTETLEYDRAVPLRLHGSGQTIDGSHLTDNLAPIFAVTTGADLTVTDLVFDGGGGYDFFNQGGGKGIFVKIPRSRTGVVSVSLTDVTVLGTGNHGVHVSDCTLGDECGSGGGGAGDGSRASIDLRVENVRIDGAGFGTADADGIRVDERNDGYIFFQSKNSTFVNVGADGVELDEGNDGDVIFDVRGSVFKANGAYCLADDPPTPGGPCDDEGDPDVDDGFDVDEAGFGSISGRVTETNFFRNLDEGMDLDEEGAGGFAIRLARLYARGNADEGIKISEEGRGDVGIEMRRINIRGNNGRKEGIEIEEADKGDVRLRIEIAEAIGGKREALKIEQTGDPASQSTVQVIRSNMVLDLEGVTHIDG